MNFAFKIPYDLNENPNAMQTLMQIAVWCIRRYERKSGLDFPKYLRKERREHLLPYLMEHVDDPNKDKIFDGYVVASDTWFVGLISFTSDSHIPPYIYVRVPDEVDAVELRLTSTDLITFHS